MGRPDESTATTSKKITRHLDIPTETFTPQAYQVELLDSALTENTLVCVGGISSRMFLTVMLLKETADNVRMLLSEGGKRSVLLVNNGDDMNQYYKVLEQHTDLHIGRYFKTDSTQNVEYWQSQWQEKQVLIFFPCVFHRLLEMHVIDLTRINVLIFDDCHLSIKQDHMYNQILHYVKHEKDIRTLGLTSCFTSQKCQDPSTLIKTIHTLEKSYNANAETSNLVYAERYGINPKEFILHCEEYVDKTGLLDEMAETLDSCLQFLTDCQLPVGEDGTDYLSAPKTVITECLNILYSLGPWCCASIAQMFLTQVEKIIKHEHSDMGKKFLRFTATQLRYVITFFEDRFNPDYNVEELLLFVAPKVRELIHHLRAFKPSYEFKIIVNDDVESTMDYDESDMSDDSFSSDGTDDDENEGCRNQGPKVSHVAIKREDSGDHMDGIPGFGSEDKCLCGIVFVEHRYVAFALNKFIEEASAWDEDLCFIKCHHITGQTNGKTDKSCRKQEAILRRFRMQELNLLVAMDMLEEGMNIPKCNLIVKFNVPKDYKSYSQSKGRARARDSQYVVLVDGDQADSFEKELQTYKHIEDILKGRSHKKQISDENGEEADNVGGRNEDLVPYKPVADVPIQVSEKTSIALVNRYCAKLPRDAFTHLTPKCSIVTLSEEGQTKYRAVLRLPINSPMKREIVGLPMSTVKRAKQAVALKVCELLHKTGELDDQLMPVGKELFIKEEEDSVVWEGDEGVSDSGLGTTRRKKYYIKKIAPCLLQSKPQVEKCNNYVYLINMKLTVSISEEQNTKGRRVYDPVETSRSFGILSCKPIARIPAFPVYTRSGEVEVSITPVNIDWTCMDTDLTKLQEFHQFIFTNVLRLEKDPMTFDPIGADVGYLIIPLNHDLDKGSLSIDWKFIEKVHNSNFQVKRNIYDSKRDMFHFIKEDYADAVVMPSYRNIDQPQYFYVAEIRDDLNPCSAFPSPELYKTFSDYYTTKYGLVITNPDQPLLDVDYTSVRLNLLTPRYMNQKGVALPTSSAETRKARRENLQQKQILVPELCEIHVIPASLWRKAVCLPTILYRMNHLLVAEEIRIKISQGAHIGQVKIPDDFSFPALDFGFNFLDDMKDISDEDDDDEDAANSDVEEEGDGLKKENKDKGKNQAKKEENEDDDFEKNEANDWSKFVEKNPEVVVDGLGSANSVSVSQPHEESGDNACDVTVEPEAWAESQQQPVENWWRQTESSGSGDRDKTSNDDPCVVAGQPVSDQSSNLKKGNSEHSSEMSERKEEYFTDSDSDDSNYDKNAKVKVQDCDSDGSEDNVQYDFHSCNRQSSFTHKNSMNPGVSNESKSCDTKHHSVSKTNHAQISQNGIEEHIYTKKYEQIQANPKEKTLDITALCKDLKNADLKLGDSISFLDADSLDDYNVSTMSNGFTKEPLQQADITTVHKESKKVMNCPKKFTDCDKKEFSQKIYNGQFYPTNVNGVKQNSKQGTIMDCGNNKPQVLKGVGKPLSHDMRMPLENGCEKEKCGKDASVEASIVMQKLSEGTAGKRNSIPVSHHSCSDSKPDSDELENICNTEQEENTENKNSSSSNIFPNKNEISQTQSGEIDTQLSTDDVKMCQDNKNQIKAVVKPQIDLLSEEPVSYTTEFSEKIEDMFTNIGSFDNSGAKKKSSPEDEVVDLAKLPFPQPLLSLDEDIDLSSFIGPSPCTILQALTMSSATDFFSLERLETIGDSFLKYAITVYLYCTYPGIHEGKLSYLRSKQVSNLNLYRLGKKKGLAECLISTKFEPYENWLPPGYVIMESKKKGPIPQISVTKCPESFIEYDSICKKEESRNSNTLNEENWMSVSPAKPALKTQAFSSKKTSDVYALAEQEIDDQIRDIDLWQAKEENDKSVSLCAYNLQTVHTIPDKSIADCVESLIGCYLTSCGKRAALQFMSWMGLKVLPPHEQDNSPGNKCFYPTPPSPLLTSEPGAMEKLERLLTGYSAFEDLIGYKFHDRSYLLQAFTHASYHYNTITDCYQRLEFLGDAILDYVITRHLYELSRDFSPGVLTDLRSALVNNNIFAALAVKWNLHKYFKSMSPPLFQVMEKFIARQKECNDEIDLEEEEQADEDANEEYVELEAPKALGDIFESLAGAIYLDSGLSLDVVWRVFYRIMKPQIDKYLTNIPKSPVRDLLEMEPERAMFQPPKRTLEGKIRVSVNVVDKGVFVGIGRNYRIAKSAAARKALRCIKTMQGLM